MTPTISKGSYKQPNSIITAPTIKSVFLNFCAFFTAIFNASTNTALSLTTPQKPAQPKLDGPVYFCYLVFQIVTASY